MIIRVTSLVVVAVGLVPAVARATALVPASIDPMGRTDVTAQLNRFVASVPDGETVAFQAGARYRIDGTLEFRGRTGMTLDGRGASLVAGTRGGPDRAHVRLVDGARWTIRDLTVRGANPAAGQFDAKHQWQHGFDLRGVHGATLEDVKVFDVLGDDVYIGLSTTDSRWSQDVAVLDSSGMGSGRMAIAITGGRRVTVRGGSWSSPGLSTFDIEPNGRPGGADRILIEDTVVGAGSRHWTLSLLGRGPISNVTMRRNRLTGRPLSVHADQDGDRPQNIVIQDNTSTVEFAGPPPAAMTFHDTDGVTVAGNVQPVRSDRGLAMVAAPGSTRVDVAADQPYARRIDSGGDRGRYVVIGVSLLLLVLLRRHVATRGASRGPSA